MKKGHGRESIPDKEPKTDQVPSESGWAGIYLAVIAGSIVTILALAGFSRYFSQ
ncbi:MAG: hypothetical protein O2880_09865 [Proteobacteria bacterium]|nr:hypothetical protein [Pseudomonadota bacterium]